ncbi:MULTISPECIES: chaplin [Streptomyces]|uniref:chaplin n=1 Tax=Streptomyces TaxID=1883 RepID=UPI000FD80559|nr:MULTISPECIES: chaplin [Streptomyces]UFQ19669.1 chaplin [Streptomyces huasconensis]WCL89288.1 chaplin [Streptomyces sp. JCM 35825]
MRVRTLSVAVLIAASAVVGGAGQALADDGPSATGHVHDSPGIVSGNAVQVPVEADLNVCGNTIDIIGLLNPASDNKCKTN